MNALPTLFLILFTPLFSAAVIALFCRRRGRAAALISVGAAALVLGLSLFLLFDWDGVPWQASEEWLRVGDLTISMGFYFNNLSALMLFVVSFVGFWIHLFSVGYMKSDRAQGRYFGGLSLFMFAMLGIVLADNLFMLFIFWELVGFSSYLLINHYFERQSAADASKKAFIVNRLGDGGFLIGIIWCYWQFGTVDIPTLQEAFSHDLNLPLTGIGLCLFCGVLGKSAQMPLHVWLPDAMEGPTPVSALIHAATMVAAGVYFLGRVFFLFTVEVLTVMTWVGTITAVCAAFSALGQNDIKKILAYSTLSQLGYMVAVFGLGTAVGMWEESTALMGVAPAMFHLTTHAFFKALLFLGAGSVIHACNHEQDIFKMGGLVKRMPLTFLTFTIGVVAIAGVPYAAAGFFSKEAILYLAFQYHSGVFAFLAFAAILTAFYMGRLWVIAFLGKPMSQAADYAKESSWVMLLPLLALGVLSLLGGWIAYYPDAMRGFLETIQHPHATDQAIMLSTSLGCSLLGLVGAWFFYKPATREESRLPKNLVAALTLFKFDRIYACYVDKVQQRVANLLGFLDQLLISGLLVRGTAGMVGLVGLLARSVHVGNIHGYVYWFLGGVLLFWAFAVGWLG